MLSDLRQKRINPIDVMKRLCTIFWFKKKKDNCLTFLDSINRHMPLKNSYFYDMIILCAI